MNNPAPSLDFSASPYRVNLDPGDPRRPGVLLIHGFTAAPTEMRPLAEHITRHEPAWAIRCVQLAGHGGSYEDLRRSTDADWFESAVSAYDELRACCGPVIVAGLSMGAALACRLAADFSTENIAGLVLLAPVFDLHWPANWLVSAYGLFRQDKPKSPKRAEYYRRHGLYSHMSYPIKGVQCMRRNGRTACSRLSLILVPALIVVGRLDKLATESDARRIAGRLGSYHDGRVEIMTAPRSVHVLTTEPDNLDVFERCMRFMRGACAEQFA